MMYLQAQGNTLEWHLSECNVNELLPWRSSCLEKEVKVDTLLNSIVKSVKLFASLCVAFYTVVFIMCNYEGYWSVALYAGLQL